MTQVKSKCEAAKCQGQFEKSTSDERVENIVLVVTKTRFILEGMEQVIGNLPNE